MKQCCVILLVLVMATAMFAACTNSGAPENLPSSQTPEPTTPDFSAVDFTGTWSVSQIKDSSGNAASKEKLQEMGADFNIELTGNGIYIISDAQGKEIGQGTYSLLQDKLTLTASGGETVYTIQDQNTIFCTAADGSVTVMTRCCIDSSDSETGGEESGNETGDQESDSETGDQEEEAAASSEA